MRFLRRPAALLLGALAVAPADAQTPSFDLVWEARPDLSPNLEEGTGVAFDPAGGAWVAGWRAAPGALRELFLTRYGPAGQELWTRAFGATMAAGGPGGFFDNGERMRIVRDGFGGVFIAGSLLGTGFADPSLGGYDAFVARFDGAGQLLWSTRLGGPRYDDVRALLEDGAGGVLAVGITASASATGSFDGYVTRVDGSGGVVWSTPVQAAGVEFQVRSGATDGAGGAYLVGFGETGAGASLGASAARVDAAGQVAWFQTGLILGADFRGAASDGAGGLFAVGRFEFPDNGLVARVDGFGNALWSRVVTPTLGSTDRIRPSSVTLLGDGDALVAGTRDYAAGSSLQPAAYLQRFSPAGNRGPSFTFEPSSQRFSRALDVVGDQLGSVFVGGLVDGEVVGTDLANWRSRTWLARIGVRGVGVAGCAGRPNSTGGAAQAAASGGLARSDDALTVFATGLPPSSLGYFIASLDPGHVSMPGGSQGDLCLGGAIGRLNRPGEVRAADAGGRFHLRLDLGALPTPTGTVSVVAGQPWHFQAWYRDANPAPTSNFTGSVVVTLQ